MDKEQRETVTAFYGLFAVLLAILMHSIVIRKLWQWFFVPLGFPSLSYPQLAGVVLSVSYVTQPSLSKRIAERDKMYCYTMAWLKPVLALLVGWIYFRRSQDKT